MSPPPCPPRRAAQPGQRQRAGHHGTGAVPCRACGRSMMPKARAGTSRPGRSLPGRGQAFHHALSADRRHHGTGQRGCDRQTPARHHMTAPIGSKLGDLAPVLGRLSTYIFWFALWLSCFRLRQLKALRQPHGYWGCVFSVCPQSEKKCGQITPSKCNAVRLPLNSYLVQASACIFSAEKAHAPAAPCGPAVAHAGKSPIQMAVRPGNHSSRLKMAGVMR